MCVCRFDVWVHLLSLHSVTVTASIAEISIIYQVSIMENFGESKVNGSQKDNSPLHPNNHKRQEKEEMKEDSGNDHWRRAW